MQMLLTRNRRSFICGEQSIMKNEDVYTPGIAHGEPQDDISALRDAFSLHAFSYVDIAREERLKEVVARWPLLAETVASLPGRPH